MSSDHRPSLRAEFWQSEAPFLDGGAEWNALCSRIPGATVFLRHEWFDAAWRWCQREAALYMVAFREGERLVGLAPMVVRRVGARLRHRRLTFLTVPDTQACDVLAEPRLRGVVIESLLKALAGRGDWDVLELTYLTPATAEEITACARAGGHRTLLLDQGNNPGIALQGSWDEYYGRRSRRLKKGNNLIANKLKKGGHSVHLEAFRGDSEEQTAQLLDDIIAVSAQSWKRHTSLSLDFPGPHAFIRRLSTLAASNGWLSIWRLRVDGRTLAMEYQISFGGRVHALRSDFDDRASELSPGTYLNWKMLEQMFAADQQQYLMGPGENAYKLRWAETYEPIKRVVIYGPTLQGRLQAWLDLRLRPAARRLRDRWQARRNRKENP